jgi:hypothetical protein
VNGILEHAAREKLLGLGIPTSLVDDRYGAYLAAFVTDAASPVHVAAEAAGLSPHSIRTRRRRDAIFAHAEVAARSGTDYTPPSEDETMRPSPQGPWPDDRHRRLHRAADICREIGVGPWPV